MTATTIVTEDLGGSALSRAAREGALPEWYRVRPVGRVGWAKYLAEVGGGVSGAAWLDTLLPALAPAGRARERLQRVAGAGGVVISTGQQPGLFGGPLMTLIKALSALSLADVLERELGIPVAPVFWAATDDADFDEASTVDVAVRGGSRTLRLQERPALGTPMSRAALGDIGALAEELSEACGSIVDPVPLEAVRTAYTPGMAIGEAYVRLLRTLLEPLGIGVLDASHPAVRRAAVPVVTRVLECAGDIERALVARSSAIRAAGYTPQVEDVAGLSLVFTSAGGTKRRIPLRESETARREAPEILSPNVLLRPLVERFILPSAAYLGGPGEIAYFAQVNAVAQELALPVPLVLPRWSVTIIEPQVANLLSRLGLAPSDLARPGVAEGRIARATLPSEVTRALDSMRRTISTELTALRAGNPRALVPPASVEGVQHAIEHRLARLERRYVAAVKRHELRLMSDIETVRGALHPGGTRQERRLSFIPFLTRGGRPLTELLLAEGQRHAAALVEPLASDAASTALVSRS